MDIEIYCKKCKQADHCCIFMKKEGFTFLTKKDALTIKRKTEKEYDEFLDDSPLFAKLLKMLKDDDPALEGRLRYEQLDSRNRLLRLKTKKDGRCIFLDDEHRCEIYSIRPNICRIFPFWAMRLVKGKLKVISHDHEPKCGAMKWLLKKGIDVEESISSKEKNEIKRVYRRIENEKIEHENE